MEPTPFNKRFIEKIILWIIPPICLGLSGLYWWVNGLSIYFGYLFLTPVIFIFPTVGIAAGPLKLWRWETTILPSFVPIQRPLVYTAYLNFIFVLAGRLLVVPTTFWTILEAGFVIGFIMMLFGFTHDNYGIDSRIYHISGKKFNPSIHGTLRVVSRYAFYFFGSLGLILGMSAKVGYYFLYESKSSPFSWPILALIVAGLAGMPFLAGLGVIALKRKKVFTKKQ